MLEHLGAVGYAGRRSGRSRTQGNAEIAGERKLGRRTEGWTMGGESIVLLTMGTGGICVYECPSIKGTDRNGKGKVGKG